MRGYHIEDPGPSTCDNQKPIRIVFDGKKYPIPIRLGTWIGIW